jgi:ferritin-like metal-binding protein YciE
MQTAHELFIHELNDMLSGERQLLEALQEQEESASRDDLKKAFASHRAQTENHVERLEQCFEEIGETPQETECKGIAGLVGEFKTFKEEEDPSEDILDVFSIGAAKKVESYEINAYRSLIDLAQEMDHRQAAKLLNQNLKEEEQTFKKMEAFSKKIKPEQMGMEAAEEQEDASSKTRKGMRVVGAGGAAPRAAQSGRSKARRIA